MSFTWIPIYKEIAHGLIEYQGRETELIDMVRRWSDAGIKTVKLSDKDSEDRSIPLAEMDPFTFFANWNRGGDQNRLRILNEIKSEWDLASDMPTDFDGVPTIFPLSSWFFRFLKERSEDDVPALWRLFVAAARDGVLDKDSFNHSVHVSGLARKVTMGLFWIDPDDYLSLDKNMRGFLASNGIDTALADRDLDCDSYTDLIKRARETFPGEGFVELSRRAYEDIDQPAPPKPSDDGVRYWLYAPGRGASLWDECYENGTIAIGWGEIGDLSQYAEVSDYVAAMKTARDSSRTYRNVALACYEFAHVMKPGDIIIAKRGRSEYLGYGVVESDYVFDESRSEYQHLRDVAWKKRGVWTETEHAIVLKTLTDITKHPDYVARLQELIIEDTSRPQPAARVKHPRNLILYGPPGTGKTYKTVIYAVAIFEGKPIEQVLHEAAHDYEAVKKRFDDAVERGEVVFVSFHQSYSYEEFIEGIKPYVVPETKQVSYRIEDGLFKRLCTEAVFSLLAQSGGALTTGMAFSDRYVAYLDHLKSRLKESAPVKLPTRAGGQMHVVEVNDNDTVRTASPNGSRTYAVSKNRMARLYEQGPDASVMTDIAKDIRDIIGGCNTTMYWSVLNDFNRFERSAQSTGADEELSEDVDYETKSRLVSPATMRSISTKAIDTAKPYIIIIDEINRGNVASIFGELITLIEENKRIGMREAAMTTLPYSKEPFGVPPNIHIVGTMNTADRSVEALDTALRRRFSFVHMKPDANQITGDELEGLSVDVPMMLKTINDRIEKLLDPDHCIGHAYFMGWKADPFSELKRVFANRIIPLLQEHFYDDAEKIGLVLGDQFVRVREHGAETVAGFATGFSDQTGSFEEKLLYEIVDPLEFEDESPFISIYEANADDSEDQ